MDVVYGNRFIEPELAFELEECAARENKKVHLTAREYCTGAKATGSLSFHSISYIVEQKRTYIKNRPPKIILNNVR